MAVRVTGQRGSVSTMAVGKDLFVSYSREDAVKEFVRNLKRDLERAQLSVWLDVEDIPAGTEESLAVAIAFSALSNCKALIAILTKNYISSTFCKGELYFACCNQKPIFPVVREEGWDAAVVSTECSEGVKYMKATCNWVSFLPSDDDGAALQKLVQNVSKQELVVRNVLNVLHEAGFSDGHWFQLGQQLIETTNLMTIKANHHEASSCMIDTISQWLRSDLKASWEKLAEAVTKVGGYREATAEAVRQKAGIGAAVASATRVLPSQPPSNPAYTTFGHLGKRKQRPPSPEVNTPSNNSEQQRKKRRMSPQCRQFVTLINKLRRILSKDPDSEEVLIRMKLSIDTLRGQDESIAIEPEVYRSAQSVAEFFTVMAKYWNCYDDHDLLRMVIEETENEEAISVLNDFLQNRNPRLIIPTEKCPEAPFQSPCSGRSNDSTTAFIEIEKDANGLGDSFQQIGDTQHRFFPIPQHSLPTEEVESLHYLHYHPGCSNELPRNRVPVIAEVHVNQINGRMYECVKSNVATPLKVPRAAMSLWEIYEGSCIIVWHVSKEVAAGIKRIQLSQDDQEKLLQCAVLTLSCDNKCLFAITKEKLQEMVTSGKIQEFAEPVEVVEGGEIECVQTSDGKYECKVREEEVTPAVSLVPKEDPDTTDVPSVSSLSPPPPLHSSAKEKQSGREERVKEKSIEQIRQSQVSQFKRLVRVITSDEEFERELRQAGEALVVVDFTTERCQWTVYLDLVFAMLKKRYTEAKFLSVDAEKCKSTATKYDVRALPICGLPIYAFFRKGELLRMFHGNYREPVAAVKYFLECKEEGRHSLVKSITSDEELEQELTQTGETLVVVDFTAEWCGWSVIMDPINAVFSEHFTAAHFLKVDSEKCRRAASQYGIRSFPTFAFIRGGKILDKFSGANPEKLVVTTKHFLGSESKGAYSPGKGYSRVRVVNSDKHFERELRQPEETLVVANFTAAGSRWSMFMDPVFAVLSEHYPTARFLQVDAENCRGAAFRCDVRMEEIPMFAFFRKANLLHKFSGFQCKKLATTVKHYLEGKGVEEKSSKEQPFYVIVDPSEPTTKVKISLADGSNLIETFNHSHTVGDLRHFISCSRPELAASSYTLVTSYPEKELKDDAQTLAAAELFNAFITQKTEKLAWK